MLNTMKNYEGYVQGCTDFMQRLVQTPSVNGKDNEKAMAELVVAEATKLGLASRVIEQVLGRPNVFVGEGFDSPDGLLLVSHGDTVPVGDETKWDYPPFGGEIVDGRLYGRGALDCKGGLALSLYALKALKDQGKGNLAKMLMGVDEESGADSQFGVRAALAEGLNAESAIYTYGGRNGNELTIGHRGLVRVWVTCRGESAHSGSSQWQDGTKGESAITGIIDFIEASREIRVEGENEYFPGYKTVITPTLVNGGEGESLVPSKAEVLLDIRTLPGGNANVLRQIEDIIQELNVGKRQYAIRIKNNIPAVITDPNSRVVQEAIRLKGEIFGFPNPRLKGSGPANESYMLVEAGIPTIVGFGATGDGFHSANEYAEIDSLEKSLAFMVEMSLRLGASQEL
jgi:succinyl-diaminopimelate desuccinylase